MLNKKTISLLLAIVFFCTMAVIPQSGMVSVSEHHAGLDRTDTGSIPGFREMEQEKSAGQRKKKFPWLLVGGFVAGAAIGTFLLFRAVKKNDDDIRGTWEMHLYLVNEPMRTLRFSFNGSKTEGEYRGDSYGLYTVNGKNVEFGYFTHATYWNYSGSFYGHGRMSGSHSFASIWSPARNGTWWARKISSDTGGE
jgi:hypothetical protein